MKNTVSVKHSSFLFFSNTEGFFTTLQQLGRIYNASRCYHEGNGLQGGIDMKRLVSLMLLFCMLACVPTPEQEIVINKGDGLVEDRIAATPVPVEQANADEPFVTAKLGSLLLSPLVKVNVVEGLATKSVMVSAVEAATKEPSSSASLQDGAGV